VDVIAENRLGRPPLPAEQRHEVRRAVYLRDAEHREYLRLFKDSPHHSESAFLAELMRLGAAEYERRREALASAASVGAGEPHSQG
jgi:hypothetical protein